MLLILRTVIFNQTIRVATRLVTHQEKRSMKQRTMCLSVSKKNARYVDLLDKYVREFNSNKADTIFRIVSEYHHNRLKSSIEK